MASDRSCCVNCKHFSFWPGDPGYSEFTPGSDMAIDCNKSHWHVGFDTSEGEFRTFMRSSLECKDFDGVLG